MFRGGVESVLITVEKGVDKFVYKYEVFNGERRGGVVQVDINRVIGRKLLSFQRFRGRKKYKLINFAYRTVIVDNWR